MAKMTISESRLHELIQESIYEVLQEAQYDEGIGHFLGNLWQSAKNKWNNFKGDFEAGKHNAWYNNRDYDSFGYYGDKADDIRNFGGPEYSAHRYNTTVDRNSGAKHYYRKKYGDEGMPYPNQGGGSTTTLPQSPQGQTNPSPMQVQGHPDLGGSQQTPQSTPAAPQTTQQTSGVNIPKAKMYAANLKAEFDEAMRIMQSHGIVPVYNKNNQIVQWENEQGKRLTPEQNRFISDFAKRNTAIRRRMVQENKKAQLSRLINEVNALQSKFNNRKRK
jgi:hypothetical protein